MRALPVEWLTALGVIGSVIVPCANMRTLILSDLHLGCRADARSLESARSVIALLRHLGSSPLRVILNGDTFDFIARRDSFSSDVLAVMRGCIDGPADASVLASLGRIVDAGGELVVRPGEDDRELGESAIQRLFVTGLGVSLAGSGRVSFAVAGVPTVVESGGVRVLVTRTSPLANDAGRRLVVELLNPLRLHYGVGLAEQLRPDCEAAVLAALAVNPTAIKLVLRSHETCARGRAKRETWVRLIALLGQVVLDPEERQALVAALDPELMLAAADYPHLDRARLRLFTYSLGRCSGTDADGLRSLLDSEAREFREKARRLGAAAVLFAYSHVPTWSEDDELCLVDTGSWGPTIDGLVGVDDPYRRILEAWEQIPQLGGLASPELIARAGLRHQQTAALVESRSGGEGARLTLMEWSNNEIVRLRETLLRPCADP